MRRDTVGILRGHVHLKLPCHGQRCRPFSPSKKPCRKLRERGREREGKKKQRRWWTEIREPSRGDARRTVPFHIGGRRAELAKDGKGCSAQPCPRSCGAGGVVVVHQHHGTRHGTVGLLVAAIDEVIAVINVRMGLHASASA